MKSNLSDAANKSLICQPEDGKTGISVRLEGKTAWLDQAAMAELYQTTPQNITLHINNIYNEGELEEGATCKDYLQVQKDKNKAQA